MGGSFDSTNLRMLREIMARYKLSRKDVAKLSNRSLQTVHQWFSMGKTSHRRIKDEVLERIVWKLKSSQAF
jgi:hypothetical protein